MEQQRTIEGHRIPHLLGVVRKKVEGDAAGSVVLCQNAEAIVPKFAAGEIVSGRVLGRGGFCVVEELEQIILQDGAANESFENRVDDEHAIYNRTQDRAFMASHYLRTRKGKKTQKDCRYAIKRVSKESKSTEVASVYVSAVGDLATEARFLAVVRHPHIIKMRAMENASLYSYDFFVVLDKLFDIMPARLKKWKKQDSGITKIFRSKKARNEFWVERLSVAFDLSNALNYLHGMSIIYRDLKPDNIGFDVRDDVKIFDFGLAKELKLEKRLEDGTYKLTGDTGTMRYMAPEVYLNEPYNETADAYSFGIMCWQILAIEKPYAHCLSENQMVRSVFEKGNRPVPNEVWGDSICQMLRATFSRNLTDRPTMADISEKLRTEINKYSVEDVDESMDISRRSRISYEDRLNSNRVDIPQPI